MTNYTIRITGEGNVHEISNALRKIADAIQSGGDADSPNVEDLDGAEWEDCTLLTEISKVP